MGQLGIIGGAVTAILLVARFALLAAVSLWSLKADRAGRAHALALIRLLKPGRGAKDRSP
ncbi:hypothetical protein AB0M83_36190 [Amycolatopsis sp. NPDC051106]|jgi:hypothetical protein|uniref:hypothetical protein n=1 Tax=unclassified Amycolatopsis TaxID=2618356 RepID=UPI0034453F3B